MKDEYFTKAELTALKKVKNAIDNLPKNINIYVLGNDFTACKRGISSFNLTYDLGYVTDSGDYLHELHDTGNYFNK